MNAIEGTVKNRQIVISEPMDWPDGAKVRIELVPDSGERPKRDPSQLGMTEAKQGEDSESIAQWIAEFDAIPALQMTPEEEATWQAARQAQKEFELATFNERAKKLRGMWE